MSIYHAVHDTNDLNLVVYIMDICCTPIRCPSYIFDILNAPEHVERELLLVEGDLDGEAHERIGIASLSYA